MTQYEIALKVLPFLVNTEFAHNPYQMVHRAYQIAEAFEEVSKQKTAESLTNFAENISMSLSDDPVISLSGAVAGFEEYDFDRDNILLFTEDTLNEPAKPTSDYVIGNVDLSGLNISLDPVKL